MFQLFIKYVIKLCKKIVKLYQEALWKALKLYKFSNYMLIFILNFKMMQEIMEELN